MAGIISIGEWAVFLPLFAMAEDGGLHRILVIVAFFALPLAAAADFVGAGLLSRHLGKARRLLAVAAGLQLFVEGSVAFPLFIGGVFAFGAAALAFSTRPAATTY
jgi:hypothetical protein